MNNIQKNFKAKGRCGLSLAVGGMINPTGSRTGYADGGVLETSALQQQARETNDPDVQKAAITERWAVEDRERAIREAPVDRARMGIYAPPIPELPSSLRKAPVAQPSAQPVAQPVAYESSPASNPSLGFKGMTQGEGSMLKSFDMRLKGLGMADGGVIPETPDQMMARMAAKYGTTGAQPAPAPQPVAQPAPVQAPPPKSTGFFGGMQQKLGRTGETLKGLGLAEGGIVRGKGGPTDDAVPMTVGGVDVNLSNKEAVLPVKTVHALGGPEAVEELIEETNGKPPVRAGLRQGGNYNRGGFVDDFGDLNTPNKFQKAPERVVLQQQLAAAEPVAQAAPTGQTLRTGAAVEPVATHTMPAEVKPLPRGEQFGRNAAKVYQNAGGATGIAGKAANAIVPAAAAFDTIGDSGIRVEGNREGDATNESASGLQRVSNAAKEVGLRAGDWGTKGADMLMDIPLWAANKVGATSDGKPLEYGLINKNYRQGMRDAQLDGVTIPQSAAEREMTDARATSEADAYRKKYAPKDGTYGTVDQAAIDALKASNAAKVKSAEVEAATKAGNFAGQNKRPELITKADQDASDTFGNLVDQATGVSRGGDGGLRGMAQRFDAYTNNDTVREARNAQLKLRGDGARYEKDSNGKLTITNSGDFDGSTKMAYMGADGKPTSDWSKTQQFAEGTAQAAKEKAGLRQLQYENAKFNATSDQITDPNARYAGLRGLAQYDKEETLNTAKTTAAAKAQHDNLQLQLTARAQDITAAGQRNMQGNNVRDFNANQSKHIASRTKDMIETAVPTAGLKDDDLKKASQKRSDFEQAFYSAFKRQPADDNEFNKEAPRMKDQALLSLAMRDAIQNAGFLTKLGNVGHDMWSSLHAQKPQKRGDDLVFEGGFTIPYKDVIGKNADLDAAYKARMNAKEEQ